MILPILRMIFSTLLGVVFKKISEGSCSRNFKIFGSGWGRHFFAKKSRNFGAYSMLLLIRFFLKIDKKQFEPTQVATFTVE